MACRLEVIAGRGATSFIARARLSYSRDRAGPSSVIVKLPSEDPQARQRFAAAGAYDAESLFYTEMAARSRIRTPRALHVERDAAGFVLVLEDLERLREGVIDKPCDWATADIVVNELARLHAAWWNSDFIANHSRPPLFLRQVANYSTGLTAFLERFGSLVPKSLLPQLAGAGELVRRLEARLQAPPFTCSHGDAKLDNIYFDDSHANAPPVFIDWGAWRLGSPAFDVAFFLADSLDPQTCERDFESLIESYHSALEREGVNDYSPAALKQDIRLQMLPGLLRRVLVGAWETGQPVTYQVRVHRFFEILERLHIFDGIP